MPRKATTKEIEKDKTITQTEEQLSQTDIKNTESEVSSGDENITSSQTDIVSSKNLPEGVGADGTSQTGNNNEETATEAFSDETSSKEKSTDSSESGTEEEKPKKAPRRRTRKANIVTIDETIKVETEYDKQKNDLLDLVESLKSKKILSGTIQGIERSKENQNISYAVLYHGEFKIIIPAEEAVEAPDDFRDMLPADVFHYMITKRLGAEIDYIIKGIDPKTGIAAANGCY